MRICIITKHLPPASTEGIPRNRWDYARQFKALGHEVHVITSGRDACEKIVQGVYIHQIQPWEKEVSHYFSHLKTSENVQNQLTYSYLVYKRIKQLNEVSPIHLIESPLWDIEGYIARLKFPEIPFVVRLETTSMLLKEILTGKKPEKDVLNEIETHFLQIADAYVFDSWSILKETERLYRVRFENKPYAVIHHGIDLKGVDKQTRAVNTVNDRCRILSVGRLESRKGSDILVREILPLLLQQVPDIELHLVGKDSGEWDGFKDETGLTYHQYIEKHFKPHLNKQIFLYGYVSDEKLDVLYSEADIVLALSKYESFGLLYLEAMRKGKPLIVFDTGAVPEIFDHEKDACVIPLSQPGKVIDAIVKLKNDPALRQELGNKGLEKLINQFSSERMAEECSRFFENLVFKINDRVIYQVMNCLTDRDGVSNTTIDYDRLLKERGQLTQILGTSATTPVKHLIKPIESVHFNEADMVIYHYWNFCEKAEYFTNLTYPKKVFFFHNITTPTFFAVEDEAYHTTSRGFKQLSSIDNFDVYVAHTAYSLEILRHLIRSGITTHIIPPLIDKDIILKRNYNTKLAADVRKKYPFHIIFVGSVAPHKKQTDLVNFFKYYSQTVNPNSHLTIIGGGAPKYTDELKKLIRELQIDKQVTVTGKVSDEDLYGYYRSADLYLSMCEHEGFGVPLAEAMVFNIPVVAYDCTAIPETVGDNGCLFKEKDAILVAGLVEKVRVDKEWKNEVLSKQWKHLQNFSKKAIQKAFEELNKLADEKHFERIERVKSSEGYLLEEFLFYDDKRLFKDEPAKTVDNQFVMVDHKNGILVEEEFSEAELNFLSHNWSGKVMVQIDNLPVEIFDLFSSERNIKAIKLRHQLESEVHAIRIRQTGEKNSFSKGNEVLLHSIKLMKPFRLTPIAPRVDDNADKPDDLDLLPDEGLDGVVPGGFSENGNDIPQPFAKVVRLLEEVDALSDTFIYSEGWSIKDEHFKFTDAGKFKDTILFEKEFATLRLSFISHAWSGMVEVVVDGRYKEVIDLYDPVSSLKSFKLKREFSQQKHQVVIKPLTKKNKFSNGMEVFFRGITVEHHKPLDITDAELEAGYKVSVIINTLDRADHLEELLKALETQTYPFFEVVVVDGPSKDRTGEVLGEYKGRIKVGSCAEANLSKSRNIGIEMSSGEYVAFIDDDALPCDQYWIENFIHFIIWNKQQRIGTVGGPVKHKHTEHYEFKNGATSDYGFQVFREEELKDHVLDGKRWVQGVPGGNNITLKKALFEIGGFDERFIYYLDETDMCIRLARKGYVVINNPINYIRHFKAPSKIRKSAYDLRWDVISRSDMFYALKTGYDILPVRLWKAIRAHKKKHFYREVVQAYKDNVISLEEYKKYKALLKKGFYEGLKWGIFNKKQKLTIQDKSTAFLNFERKVESVFQL